MRRDEIVTGGVYSNGRNKTRKVLGAGKPSRSFQSDVDVIQYGYQYASWWVKPTMTRTAFAKWAKKRIA